MGDAPDNTRRIYFGLAGQLGGFESKFSSPQRLTDTDSKQSEARGSNAPSAALKTTLNTGLMKSSYLQQTHTRTHQPLQKEHPARTNNTSCFITEKKVASEQRSQIQNSHYSKRELRKHQKKRRRSKRKCDASSAQPSTAPNRQGQKIKQNSDIALN